MKKSEIPTEIRNAIYEKTGGCFGPDPDAYGREIDAYYAEPDEDQEAWDNHQADQGEALHNLLTEIEKSSESDYEQLFPQWQARAKELGVDDLWGFVREQRENREYQQNSEDLPF